MPDPIIILLYADKCKLCPIETLSSIKTGKLPWASNLAHGKILTLFPIKNFFGLIINVGLPI